MPIDSPLTISGLTVQNGDADGNHGGGIRNVATLIIDDATITGNTDENEGGGIHTAGPASSNHGARFSSRRTVCGLSR